MSRDVVLYVADMIEACDRIARYIEGLDRNSLVAGTMAHDAVLRNLEILGETAKKVPEEVRTSSHGTCHPPWLNGAQSRSGTLSSPRRSSHAS